MRGGFRVKQSFRILTMLSIVIACFDRAEGEVLFDEQVETPQNVDGNHPDVVNMRKLGGRVELNDSGFWEAELDGAHRFVYVPTGEFTMGSTDGLDNERPLRKIHLDGYWMGKFPVTVAQFTLFVEATEFVTDAENGMGSWQWSEEDRGWIVQKDGSWKNPYFQQGDDHPVVSVSWNDSVAYCQWLSEKLGAHGELPTAAQFEKGARGIDGRKYPWGNQKPDGTRANYADINFWNKYGDARQPDKSVDDGFTETSPVGSFPDGASPYGLMDMAGNVWEWNRDVYDRAYYATMPDQNPVGPADSAEADQARENRGGGSWTDRSGHLTPQGGHNLRSAARTGDEQNSSDDHLGFRIILSFREVAK